MDPDRLITIGLVLLIASPASCWLGGHCARRIETDVNAGQVYTGGLRVAAELEAKGTVPRGTTRSYAEQKLEEARAKLAAASDGTMRPMRTRPNSMAIDEWNAYLTFRFLEGPGWILAGICGVLCLAVSIIWQIVDDEGSPDRVLRAMRRQRMDRLKVKGSAP